MLKLSLNDKTLQNTKQPSGIHRTYDRTYWASSFSFNFQKVLETFVAQCISIYTDRNYCPNASAYTHAAATAPMHQRIHMLQLPPQCISTYTRFSYCPNASAHIHAAVIAQCISAYTRCSYCPNVSAHTHTAATAPLHRAPGNQLSHFNEW